MSALSSPNDLLFLRDFQLQHGRLTEGLEVGYLEWARLEAGLADGDKTLPGEEYGESEKPTVCICPEDDKELLLFSGGDLGDKSKLKHFRFRQ